MIYTRSHLRDLIVIAAGLLIAGIALLYVGTHQAHANVITQGIIPRVATTSPMQVGPQAVTTLFAKTSSCTSRIITTNGNGVTLSFDPQLVPSATQGHYQAASTTKEYDNAVYGCGAVTAFGLTASTSLTVTGLTQ